MSDRSQNITLVVIHGEFVIGVWMLMSIRFSDRLASLEEKTGEFLRTVGYLGGYCTADQARRLDLANSPTRVLERLKRLEDHRFLRRVITYPLVYQVTKSVTRMLGTDLMARRVHPLETVRWRLLTVNFYLEARTWPAEFILDHDERVLALQRIGCRIDGLPHRRGQPYLWQVFILDLHDGCLCISVVDRPDCSALSQALSVVRRFAQCRRSMGERLSLVVAVNSDVRRRLYAKAAGHAKVREHAQGTAEPLSIYRVTLPVQSIHATTHESDTHIDNSIRGGHERP